MKNIGINNLEKLLDSISAEDVSDDYWYDIGVIEVQNILEKLSEEEWEMLRRIIKSKSEEWQKKLIYGFDEVGNEQEITIIMDLIDTNNCELFEICIDSLRCLINEKTKKLIWQMPDLLEKVESLALKNEKISQRIYIDFLERLGKN